VQRVDAPVTICMVPVLCAFFRLILQHNFTL
jgi:hypothetical protein